MTISQPTAEKLKKAGFDKKTEKIYERIKWKNKWNKWKLTDGCNSMKALAGLAGREVQTIPAPSTDELLEELPVYLELSKWEDTYIVVTANPRISQIEHKLVVEALAELWLELRKEGLV